VSIPSVEFAQLLQIYRAQQAQMVMSHWEPSYADPMGTQSRSAITTRIPCLEAEREQPDDDLSGARLSHDG